MARALTLNLRNVGVTSCSFGIVDDGTSIGGPSNAEKTAIASALVAGRGGKGSLYFWAAGNGREVGDTCDYDGYLQQGNAVGIGALTDAGDVAWYSEACAALMFVAPSNGGRRGVTAARANSLLSTCRTDFGGTSAATPFAAGVYAIVVSANPRLTAREILEILVTTATKVVPRDPSWITNKAGHRWSKTYGFGELNATKAVIMAQATRPNSKPQIHTSAPFVGCSTVSLGSGQLSQTTGLPEQQVLPCTIPDNARFGVAMWNFVSKYHGVDLVVEDVFIQFAVTHRVRRELEFALVSPSNTRIVVKGRPYDSGSDYDWEIKFVGFRGENATGRWLFGVKDTLPGTAGSIKTAAITLHGH
jgi:subtilisin-like proprotein convertase family protein